MGRRPDDGDDDAPDAPRRRGRRAAGAEVELSWDADPGWFADDPLDLEALADAPDDDEAFPLPFEERYDPDELAAIEAGPRRTEVPVTKVSEWRRRSALGAVLTGMALGLQEVFDPEEERSIVIEVDADGEPLDLPVDLFLDPDSPSGSLCIVHRSPGTKPPVV